MSHPGTRNAVIIIATKTTDKRSSTVSYTARILHTKDCRTLKQQAEEHKKGRGGNHDNNRNNKKKGYNLNKEEVKALV